MAGGLAQGWGPRVRARGLGRQKPFRTYAHFNGESMGDFKWGSVGGDMKRVIWGRRRDVGGRRGCGDSG